MQQHPTLRALTCALTLASLTGCAGTDDVDPTAPSPLADGHINLPERSFTLMEKWTGYRAPLVRGLTFVPSRDGN